MTDAAPVRARLAAFPATLADAARVAPEEPPAPGEWTPIEIVRHLIAVEEDVWHRRLGQLRTEEHPRWRWVEPGQWLGAPGAGLEDVLASHARYCKHQYARTNVWLSPEPFVVPPLGGSGTFRHFFGMDI